MFKLLNGFLDRLKIHLQGEDTIPPPLKEIFVKFLAQLLLTIGLKTQLMKEGRVCEWIECRFLSIFQLIRILARFFKVLIGKANDVQDAMAELDRLSTQEGQMVTAIILATVKQTSLDLVAMRRESYRGRDCVDQ